MQMVATESGLAESKRAKKRTVRYSLGPHLSTTYPLAGYYMPKEMSLGGQYLMGPRKYIPQLPAAPRNSQHRNLSSRKKVKIALPTKLIEVAERLRRSAIGDAINPNA
jgi:hypothetical protein